MKIKKTVALLGTVVLLLIMLAPIYIVVVCSFMNSDEIKISFGGVLRESIGYANVPVMPHYFSINNYKELLLQTAEFFVMFWNSVIQVLCIVLGQILIGVPAAWSFAKWKITWTRYLFGFYIILMLIPFQVSMVPEYLTLSNMRLLDTQLSVILPGMFATFPIFIMTRFFSAVPDELMEAARLDGANEFLVFFRIGLPLGKQGIGAAVILSFIEYWNAIEAPMTFLQQRSKWPVSLYLPNITTENAGISLAASAIILIPTLLVFLVGHDLMEEGIANTGLKG